MSVTDVPPFVRRVPWRVGEVAGPQQIVDRPRRVGAPAWMGGCGCRVWVFVVAPPGQVRWSGDSRTGLLASYVWLDGVRACARAT